MPLPELSKRMYDLDGHHGEVRTEDRPVRDSSLSCCVYFSFFVFVSVLVSEAKSSRRSEHVENVNTLQGEVRSSVVLLLYKR